MNYIFVSFSFWAAQRLALSLYYSLVQQRLKLSQSIFLRNASSAKCHCSMRLSSREPVESEWICEWNPLSLFLNFYLLISLKSLLEIPVFRNSLITKYPKNFFKVFELVQAILWRVKRFKILPRLSLLATVRGTNIQWSPMELIRSLPGAKGTFTLHKS